MAVTRQFREADNTDFDQFWPIFQQIARAGETYPYDPDISAEEARSCWLDKPRKTFVVAEGGVILGSYYIKTNHHGPGNHVCNCGYMVSLAARGKGLGTAMCEHSQNVARKLGYKAMQFNFVASSNEVAVNLWLKSGFEIAGRLPKAFEHPGLSYVDALVMYKWLQSE